MTVRSVGVVLHAGAGCFALQKRCFSPDIFFRGYWCLFGGLIEHGESAEAAARRELTEELAIVLGALSPLLELQWGAEPMGDGRPRHRTYFSADVAEATLRSLNCNEGLGMKVFAGGEMPALDTMVPWDAAALGLFLSRRQPVELIYPRALARAASIARPPSTKRPTPSARKGRRTRRN